MFAPLCKLNRHSLGGLNIGAVTPDEITLSIVAEIVQIRGK